MSSQAATLVYVTIIFLLLLGTVYTAHRDHLKRIDAEERNAKVLEELARHERNGDDDWLVTWEDGE